MSNFYQVTAIAGQTVFDLPFTYTIGSNELFGFYNGQLMYLTTSYTETTPTRVTLTFSASAGDQFVFRIPPGSFNAFQAPATFSFATRLPRPTSAPTLIFTP